MSQATIEERLQRLKSKIVSSFDRNKFDFSFRNCIKYELQELVANEDGILTGRGVRKNVSAQDCQILSNPPKRNSSFQKDNKGNAEKKAKK